MKRKVVIAGAGPAGLSAAYGLLSQAAEEFDVMILEESNAIGGISRTVNYKNNRMDIGGHRFFSRSKEVNQFWQHFLALQGSPAYDDKKLNVEKKFVIDGSDPEKEDQVMLIRRRTSRIFYRHIFFDYPIKMNAATIRNMGLFTTTKAGISYLKANILKSEEKNLEDFYVNRFGRILYQMFFERYTEKLWGRHPRDISSDWGAQRVKGLSIKTILKDILQKMLPIEERKVETSLIEEFFYPKYGPGQLWETVAAEVERLGGKIIKNAHVGKVFLSGHSVKQVGYSNGSTGENLVVDCDLFISSMPVKDLVQFLAGEVIPKQIQDLSAGLPYRDFVTIGLLLKKMNIKNETDIPTLGNIVPDCWIYVQDPGVKLGRIQIFNNWSPYMVQDVEHSIWIGLEYFCSENDSFWNLKDSKCATYGIKELVKMGIIDGKEDVLDYHIERVKKAYPAYFDTYQQMDIIRNYLDTFDNLYCVGRNGQHRYNNMDHSMITSFEAVKNILKGETDKSNIWDVNTEEIYHESSGN